MWMNGVNSNHSEECYVTANDPNTNSLCWVEAGYTSVGPNTPNQPSGEYWYWADIRPGGQGYAYHPGPILQSLDYGHGVRVYIFNAVNNLENWGVCPYLIHEWCVVSEGNQTSMTGVSGNGSIQAMNVTDYNEGIEYFNGDGTANAPNASNAFNQWQYGDTHFNYRINNGVTGGIYTSNFPAKGCWQPPPTQSSTGGEWLVYLAGSSGGGRC